LVALVGLMAAAGQASTVAVHDPSIVVAYKDASGNTYPANDAGATRTKYYYVFGTQLGAAYSTDMTDWTSFTPTFLANGSASTDYYQVFKTAATWSNHSTSADELGNLWAPDVIYNTSLKKWCMYTAVNGDDWMSSIALDTATRIEGPYAYAGEVVYSGMDDSSSGTGNADYNTVTGSSTIANRYLDANGNWQGTYGSSCIDPHAFYDQSGQLWMNYGSWSGGIFLIKLSESTGLRNNSWNYGYGTNPSSIGTKLRYDPYMGVHLAGGYYVSGEGSYIRYLQDPSGENGYYYLYESMGFYSPDGGYTMRLFRSSTVDGIYTDITGDTAIFGAWQQNFGDNLKYGFPIMQNYKWSWWTLGSVAQGGNSVLRDDDGNSYLVYHRKFDDGTIYHKVEVHQNFFNDKGWPVTAPFAYRTGVGLRKAAVPVEEIVGVYGTITHRAVDYANLATNKETNLQINADGTLSGAYTGTWDYSYSGGRHFLTLATDSGTFRGVLADQLMEGKGAKTLGFTAVNPSNERALWGYRQPTTSIARTTKIHDHSLKIGGADTVLVWSNYAGFRKDTASGDFQAEYTFLNGTSGAQSSYNWAVALKNGSQTWYLRGDAASRSTFSGSTVTFKSDWSGSVDWKTVFKNKTTRVKVTQVGTTINVMAFADSTLIETATATNCPTTLDTIYLGGENVLLDVQKISMRSLKPRQLVGTANDDGTYPAAFNSLYSDTTTVTGDFELRYRFVNQHTPESTNYWDNWILREISGTSTMLVRADIYALAPIGTISFAADWSWTDFTSLVSGAQAEMAIRRAGSIVTCSTSIAGVSGATGHSLATQTGAPTTALSFGFTNEKSLVDLQEVERVTHIGKDSSVTTSIATGRKSTLHVYTREGALVLESDREGVAILSLLDGRTSRRLPYPSGTTRFTGIKPGVYLLEGKRVLVP
jgi:beta-xylosidase